MSYQKTVETIPSTNHLYNVHIYIYTPKTKPRYMLQITHGMCEYLERYEPFIRYMTSKGVLVAGHDHAGHGNSIRTMEDLGYFSKDPYDLTLVKDLKNVSDLLTERYSQLPHFILGHSMGSFMLRKYLMKYGRSLSGIFISGTGGANKGIAPGITLAKSIAALKGDTHRSTLYNSIFFQGFNKNFKDEDDEFSWLSRDKKVRDAYRKDPKCNFVFTLNAFKGFLAIMKDVTHENWADSVPKDVPYHLFSGKEDPVGAYGKGVQETYERLLEAKVKEVTLTLYEGGRHEMLNETNKKEVYEDLFKRMEEMIHDRS
ncbi:alpha/beta fold hydrolase [Proteiniclasticum ruminis]|uniref:Lysophospholipase, alpha-beta hydrolase superfamily n=1 Tax=Proteiniclasticum ruminis TaxID=398199 RepID=A0A1I5E7W8_9CLOT|nr:alpha/beta fold hydrolase [Proteiniclasticum ruminis]SFO07396.1 Lysophospholipase, alpha-beta hydrolase superfamily [Proteiniclasticum ruminis]